MLVNLTGIDILDTLQTLCTSVYIFDLISKQRGNDPRESERQHDSLSHQYDNDLNLKHLNPLVN